MAPRASARVFWGFKALMDNNLLVHFANRQNDRASGGAAMF